MRAIDADAFVEFLRDVVKQQKYDDLKIDEALTVADVIDAVISELEGTSLDGFTNAPTIEERKKGEWIPQNHNKTNGMASTAVYYYPKCSACGHCANYTNFCPNCGADMRGEQE